MFHERNSTNASEFFFTLARPFFSSLGHPKNRTFSFLNSRSQSKIQRNVLFVFPCFYRDTQLRPKQSCLTGLKNKHESTVYPTHTNTEGGQPGASKIPVMDGYCSVSYRDQDTATAVEPGLDIPRRNGNRLLENRIRQIHVGVGGVWVGGGGEASLWQPPDCFSVQPPAPASLCKNGTCAQRKTGTQTSKPVSCFSSCLGSSARCGGESVQNEESGIGRRWKIVGVRLEEV